MSLRKADRIRLAEAFRLAEQLGDDTWENWSKAPFAVILVGTEHEFLIRHPRPADDFQLIGYDSLLQGDVHARPRQYPANFLASFPVAEVPTIVVGIPENTGHTSTSWVLTLIHEHFHQLQYSQPGYYSGVADLELSGGDQTGMWMLNYPFPYEDPDVQARFAVMARALAHALDASADELFPEKLLAYHEAREAFRAGLPEADYRYFAFQVWQEGVARYTEYQVGLAAARWHAPTEAFTTLSDYVLFAVAADSLQRRVVGDIRSADLGRRQRAAFYSVGAAKALLLDRVSLDWKKRYFSEMFLLDAYFPTVHPVPSTPTGFEPDECHSNTHRKANDGSIMQPLTRFLPVLCLPSDISA